MASIVARAPWTADSRRHLSKRRCQPSCLCGSRYRAAPHGSIGSDSPWAAVAALRNPPANPVIGCVCPLFGTAEAGVRSQWLTTGRLRAINDVPASGSAVNSPFALCCLRPPPCPPLSRCLPPSQHTPSPFDYGVRNSCRLCVAKPLTLPVSLHPIPHPPIDVACGILHTPRKLNGISSC